jgi:hypothetical protein
MQEHSSERELQHWGERVLVYDRPCYFIVCWRRFPPVKQGSDIVIQSIERVILADTANEEDDPKEDDAVGFCRFGDPTKRGMMVECMAHTQAGLYEGSFVADGNPPKLGKFQISQ